MTKIDLDFKIEFNPVSTGQKTVQKARNALLEIMLSIEENAKRLAPVDTGRLRASITTQPKKPANTITTRDGVKYGIFQEFGTSKMPAQPFMRPARAITLAKDLGKILKNNGLK